MIGYITREQLDKAGVTYDTAIPQPIWDALYAAFGVNPVGDIVVTYQPSNVMGFLQAVTFEGARMLHIWDGRVGG